MFKEKMRVSQNPEKGGETDISLKAAGVHLFNFFFSFLVALRAFFAEVPENPFILKIQIQTTVEKNMLKPEHPENKI
jgi:hypothetical protein